MWKYNLIKEKNMVGIALDNCTALEIVDEKMKIVKSDFSKNAYKITYCDEKFNEEIM